jgi:hypothetical protein
LKNIDKVLLALALLGTTGPVTPTVLPSGTYRYAIRVDGKTTASSSIVITHAAGVTVQETVAVEGDSESTTRTLDPATFATRSWAWQSDDKPTSETITITNAQATYRHADKATTIQAPAQAPAAIFDFFVAEFSTLPAMIRATGAKQYNEYCVCFTGFAAKAITVVSASEKRPAAVPAGDAALAIAADGLTITLWYDPQTLILRELDIPKERISYVRM